METCDHSAVVSFCITEALSVCCVASKELEDPEQTAERVGISALIIQVHTHTHTHTHTQREHKHA